MKKGTVKSFAATRGYGFIYDPQGTDVFVHATVLTQCGIAHLSAGDVVLFEAEVQPDGRTRAVKIERA